MEPVMVNAMWNLRKEPRDRQTERKSWKRKERKAKKEREREIIVGIDSRVLCRCLTPANLNYLVLSQPSQDFILQLGLLWTGYGLIRTIFDPTYAD